AQTRMSNPGPLAVLLRAIGRCLIAICPRNEMTPDLTLPALRTPPPIFCSAYSELAGVLGSRRRREPAERADSFLRAHNLRTTGPCRLLPPQPLSIPQHSRASRRTHA